MSLRYVGSGPYCYANSLAMVLRADSTDPSAIEVLTGSPFGACLLDGVTPFFDPPGWDPEIGLDAAIDLLGWRCDRVSGGTAAEAIDRLQEASAAGPVLAGPVEFGLLAHHPGSGVPIGSDHFLVVTSVDQNMVRFHDPHGHPHATMPGKDFAAAWAAETIGYHPRPFTMRTGFRRVCEVALPTALGRSLPAAVRWLTGADQQTASGTIGGAAACQRLAELVTTGLKPWQRDHLSCFAVRVGARRLADAAFWLTRIGACAAAGTADQQARLVGALQHPLVADDRPAAARLLRQLAPTYGHLRSALITHMQSTQAGEPELRTLWKTAATGSSAAYSGKVQQRALPTAVNPCPGHLLPPAARVIGPGPPLVRDEEAAVAPLGANLGRMLIQERLIARVREVCHADHRMDAALMYGSFAHGEGDAHSDVEFWLFFAPGQLAEVDPRAWCAQIAPLTYLIVNEFGTHVAFFPHLIRGEFHFATSADIAEVRSWPARGAPPDRMIVIDRGGGLRAALESLPESFRLMATGEEAEAVCGRFANWLVLAHHVTERGEILRALDALAQVQRHLLWMTRLAEEQTGHWLTPSRRAEADLTPQAVTALKETTACAATADDVRRALQAAWRYGRACWQQLAKRYATSTPDALFAELDDATKSP